VTEPLAGTGSPAPLPLEALIEAMPDVVAVIDAAGTIRWVCPQVHRAFGWTAEELVGRPVFDLFAKKVNHDLHVAALAEAAASPGVHGPITVTVLRPDGQLRETEFMLSNRLDDPAVGAIVAVGRDISARADEAELFRQRDAWTSSLLRGAAELIVVTDRAGRIAYASPSAERILGSSNHELAGTLLPDLVHPDDLMAPLGPDLPVDRVLGTAPGRDRVLRLRTAAGEWEALRIERSAADDLGEGFVVFTGRELRAEHDAVALLNEQTVLLERIARGAPVADTLVAIAEMLTRRLVAGDVAVGYEDHDRYRSVSPTLDDQVLAALDQAGIARAPRADRPADPELRGSEAWDAVGEAASGGRLRRLWAADLGGPDGTFGRLVLARPCPDELTPRERDLVTLAVDLAAIAVERHDLQARLAHGALHDALTGLPNRRYLLERLDDTLGRDGVRAGLLFVDIDRFKLINDSLGHEAGDHLLQEVTRRFRRALRPADLVARVGGDEFVVLCPDLDGAAEVEALAGRLADALAAPVDLPGGRVVVSASIGVVHAVGPADPVEVLQDADLAMYEAKEQGRNRISLFRDRLRNRAMARLETENALREALRADEMTLHFQPLVRLRDASLVGVEALLRWERPGFGLVKPSAFVPVATDTGLILPLGRWVIEQAARAAARWPGLEVAANLSARQLADADFVDFVADVLARHRIPPRQLCLEITEADLVFDHEAVMDQLRRCKELGLRLAIDDFGTGFATLDYLRRFSAADILKVDASFVAGITDPSSNDLAIVSAALVLADNLGFDTIAEGVETEAQRQVLENLGCELAQGHLFSESVAPAEIDALLASGEPVRAGT
jgi:diguanylate cyclase (GGDEF)-like protein/PAS domain S-box-containing protein